MRRTLHSLVAGSALVAIIGVTGAAPASAGTQAHVLYGKYPTINACTDAGLRLNKSFICQAGHGAPAPFWLYADDGVTD